MNCRTTLAWLVGVIVILSLLAASAGLAQSGGAGATDFLSLHGQTVRLFGQGLYRNDTVFFAATFKGLDVLTLVVLVPALIAAFWWAWRGAWRGEIVLTGLLGVFLYNSASLAFSAAYNSMFLIYVGLLAASLFAFVISFATLDHYVVGTHVSRRLPRRGLALFLCLAGLAPLGLWLADILSAGAAGRVPELLGSYTTVFTYAIDLAVVVPATFLSAFLLWRHIPVGYALAAIMLILLASVGLGVIAATFMQASAGIVFSAGQLFGLIGAWVVLGGLALVFTTILLIDLEESPQPNKSPRPARPATKLARPTRPNH
jgi:hypothetical protein